MNKYPTIRTKQINNIENLGYKFIGLDLFDLESQFLSILNKNKDLVKIRLKNVSFHSEMKRLFKGEV